ncbi:hypothetical protein A5819_003610 [Enterococcus sp. 7E2_DIV0204]|uniref:pLS20_p028 family conjugation system transmembrane protein n=1 Tax=unclassified Enterococcus TaxID=2608891 RepID=UPI000A33A0AD|nr:MULTISPECIES: hypothetical protein [unclassified Enterococcus]OTN84060.1 hypothetical protein A5819_003610 [Enterococcus sp. 7E2_DIV0204]OTP47252.1 hypothetical protein A5884_003627 [Enterococcus sp. 7D2_DIV0200]
MNEDEILAILLKFAEYLQIGDMTQNILRSLGMMLVKGLIWFVDTITGNFTQILSVLNFRNNDAVTELMAMLRPIQNLLLGLAILAVGVVLYLGKNAEMRNIPLNVFLIICTLSMLPNLVTQGVRLTEAIGGDVVEDQGGLGFKTFKTNTVDIYELGAKGWTTDELEEKNYLEDINFFDINERITDPKKVDPDGVLAYEARNKIGGKGYEAKKIKSSDSVLDFFVKLMVVPTYYRWRVFWIPVLITLIALAGATGLFVIRAGRLGIEIAFNYIWANITAFAHIRDLRKFKQACFEIFIGFITLSSLMVMFYLYIAFNTYVSNGSEHILVKALLYVGGAWVLFDGPAIIQKQVGVDAGLSTAGGVLAGMGAGKLLDAGKGLAETGVNAAAGAGGIFAGAMQELKDLQPPSSNKKDGDLDDIFKDDDSNSEKPSDSESSESDKESDGKEGGINDKLENESDNPSEESTESSSTPDQSEDDPKGLPDSSETDNQSDSLENSSNENGVNANMEEPTNDPDAGSTSPMSELESQRKDQSSTTEDGSSSKKPNSAEKKDSPEKPVKPKNPIGSFLKKEITTPKHMKNSGVGKVIESGSKGNALGRDLVKYTRDRQEYKKSKRDYDTYKKNKGSDE